MIIALVGGSRATLGLFAAGSLLTIFLSVWHRRTSRKFAFAGAAVLLLLIALPGLLWAAGRRSEADKMSSNYDRAAMSTAAKMMVADHPLGVGANQYVLVANIGGYSERAGVPWNTENRAAPVHNTYFLIMSEMGFLGLVSFIALLVSFIVIGFRTLGRPWNAATFRTRARSARFDDHHLHPCCLRMGIHELRASLSFCNRCSDAGVALSVQSNIAEGREPACSEHAS